MPDKILLLAGYVAAVGLIGATVVWADKKRARQGRRRVPEKTLFLLGIAGGALFMLVAMKAARHKTRKKRFMLLFPLMAVLHLAAAYFLLRGSI